MKNTLTAHMARSLAVIAPCSDRTARKWYQDPGSVTEMTRVRLEAAAKELEIPLPSSIGSSMASPTESPSGSQP